MFSTVTKNEMLDAIVVDRIGLHSGFPGSSGTANELTGGSPAYARKAAVYDAAVNGARALNATVDLDVPPGGVVAWISRWKNTGTVFRGASPAGADPREFVTDATGNKILSTAHGLTLNQTIVFYGGTPPAPLVEGTVYYVLAPTTNDFQVAATAGGAAIDLTAEATAGVLVSKIVIETYTAQGVAQVTTDSLALNN